MFHAARAGPKPDSLFFQQHVVNHLFEIVLADSPLHHLRLAVHRHEQQRGNRTDAEGRRKLLLLLGIYLVDINLTVILLGQLDRKSVV